MPPPECKEKEDNWTSKTNGGDRKNRSRCHAPLALDQVEEEDCQEEQSPSFKPLSASASSALTTTKTSSLLPDNGAENSDAETGRSDAGVGTENHFQAASASTISISAPEPETTTTATTRTTWKSTSSLTFANKTVFSSSGTGSDDRDIETGRRATAIETLAVTSAAPEFTVSTFAPHSRESHVFAGEHRGPLPRSGSLESEGSSMNSSLGSINSNTATATNMNTANSSTQTVTSRASSTLRARHVHGSAQQSINVQYTVGHYVLISNHGRPVCSAALVNRHGFQKDGAGSSSFPGGPLTPEERRGPYLFTMARVVAVHFGENGRYYTVRREDDGGEQQADAACMMPLEADGAGLTAAREAARQRRGGTVDSDGVGTPARRRLLQLCTAASAWARGRFAPVRGWKRGARTKVGACLNGHRPYGIRIRLTGVNFFVACSIWYLYIDQLRLAFLSHEWDFGCAVVSAIAWTFLVLELVMEVFIRPNGYRTLLLSDKAYLPSTVRYINNFFLVSELISLLFFVPEFICIFNSDMTCGDRAHFSLSNACLMSLYGPTRLQSFYGTAFICVMRLRIFGLIRHWMNMWINNTFVRVRGRNGEWRMQRGRGLFVPQGVRVDALATAMQSTAGEIGETKVQQSARNLSERSSAAALQLPKTKNETLSTPSDVEEKKKNEYTNDYHLTNASKIGMALFTTNAQRGLLFVFFIGLFPLIPVSLLINGGTNQEPWSSVSLLQQNNLKLNDTDEGTCAQLNITITDWIKGNAFQHNIRGKAFVHLISLVVQPVRCEFQSLGATESIKEVMCRSIDSVGSCKSNAIFRRPDGCHKLCKHWRDTDERHHLQLLEDQFLHFVRPSTTVSVMSNITTGMYYSRSSREQVTALFSVEALYAEVLGVRNSIITLFALQLGMTVFVLLGLSVLRYDAGHLVLGPLRRMLKIVAFYAKNPLKPSSKLVGMESNNERSSFHQQKEVFIYDSDNESSGKQLGTFETEQLINAVTKITDLLRKCWGVAGAGIISSNLARQMGGLTSNFNPTVPGVAVYGIFAFVGIDNFQRHLYALKGDIMILINDIAAVLHEEVYRWSYNGTGQCNKNLGGAFLMIYKIGAVSEVLAKRDKAEAVIFSKSQSRARRKSRHNKHRPSSSQVSRGGIHKRNDVDGYSQTNVDNLDLSSLPGIRSFTDRALLGLLKTFAALSRDRIILNWNNDFRLGAGVGAASINLSFGMDAGWAVEGAVGSKHKIDATYLSPHLNMAARMMSTSKQYGVPFLLSQAVQRLLSENAQDKLRHIDTVTVKGSSLQQKIYTYDARVRHDFFLYSRSEKQADLDADRYSPAIWIKDQDLLAMRSHVSSEFMNVFNKGRDEYLAGNWPLAISLLKDADQIMYEREVDEGYANQSCMSDGPCQRLITYMTELGSTAPDNWEGYRPLTSK